MRSIALVLAVLLVAAGVFLQVREAQMLRSEREQRRARAKVRAERHAVPPVLH